MGFIDGYTDKEALDELKQRVSYARSLAKTKKTKLVENYKMYHNEGEIDKVYDRTIKVMTKIIKSVHAKQQLEVEACVEGYNSEEEASQIDQLMKSDFEINRKAIKNAMKIEHACIAGPGIEIQTYNWATNRGDHLVAHPLQWIPDPAYDMNYGHQFMAFDFRIDKSEIAYGGFVNIENLKTKGDKKIEKIVQEKLKQGTRTEIDEINVLRNSLDYNDKNTYDVCLVFARFDGVPYEIWAESEFDFFLGVRPITGVTEEQKKNPYLIDFPVTITYLLPNPHDVWGDNLFTLIGDDQKMRQLFLNWGVEITRNQADLGTYAVIEDAVKNPEDMYAPDPNNRTFLHIDKKYAQIANSVLFPLNKDKQTPADVYNHTQMMEKEMYFKAGYDQGSAGIVEGSATATENVRAQKNQNQITSFNETYISEGEVDFWRKRLEMYARYGEKKIKYRMSIGGLYTMNDYSPGAIRRILKKIILKPLSKKKAKQEERKQFFMIYGQMLLSMAKTEVDKYNIVYKMCECEGLDSYEIEDLLSEPATLILAKQDLEMLNAGLVPEVKLEDDHLAYLSITRTAKESPQKEEYIQRRLTMLSMQPQKQAQQAQGADNTARSMALSKELSNVQSPSLSDIQ